MCLLWRWKVLGLLPKKRRRRWWWWQSQRAAALASPSSICPSRSRRGSGRTGTSARASWWVGGGRRRWRGGGRTRGFRACGFGLCWVGLVVCYCIARCACVFVKGAQRTNEPCPHRAVVLAGPAQGLHAELGALELADAHIAIVRRRRRRRRRLVRLQRW